MEYTACVPLTSRGSRSAVLIPRYGTGCILSDSARRSRRYYGIKPTLIYLQQWYSYIVVEIVSRGGGLQSTSVIRGIRCGHEACYDNRVSPLIL